MTKPTGTSSSKTPNGKACPFPVMAMYASIKLSPFGATKGSCSLLTCSFKISHTFFALIFSIRTTVQRPFHLSFAIMAPQLLTEQIKPQNKAKSKLFSGLLLPDAVLIQTRVLYNPGIFQYTFVSFCIRILWLSSVIFLVPNYQSQETTIRQSSLVMLAQMLLIQIKLIVFPIVSPCFPQLFPYILAVSMMKATLEHKE